eukprot:759796-Pyramimonas_sp.AAC.1
MACAVCQVCTCVWVRFDGGLVYLSAEPAVLLGRVGSPIAWSGSGLILGRVWSTVLQKLVYLYAGLGLLFGRAWFPHGWSGLLFGGVWSTVRQGLAGCCDRQGLVYDRQGLVHWLPRVRSIFGPGAVYYWPGSPLRLGGL